MDNFFPNSYCSACPPQNDITVGVILDVNRQNRSFTTISNGNPFSIIQFNVPDNAFIFDRFGRPLDFNRRYGIHLRSGLRLLLPYPVVALL